jgi:transposase
MTRRYGRAPRGQRAEAAVPHERWKTSTFIARLRNNGIVAPFVFDCAMNGAIFRHYIREQLGATLLYLPAYSPDLNPIKMLFAKLKHLLRTASARTINALWDTLGLCLERFPPEGYARCLRHCGYGHPR